MEQPNVILVLTDDQGYGDLGCTGNAVINTPNIDSFHTKSVRMTNFHVGPTCAPSRSTLMTGHYANSTGVWHTIGGRSLLRKDEISLADVFKSNGYRTGVFGKWHLGDAYPYRPQDRGFEVTCVHGGGGISQTPDYWGNDYFDDTYRVNGKLTKFTGYCTDVWFREASKFIEANQDHPFFCFISTNAPHRPLNVDPKYSRQYKGKVPPHRARFYGMISNIDENFGNLRQLLTDLDLEKNTILIFMTDNGTADGARVGQYKKRKKRRRLLNSPRFGNYGYNAGLRGKKGSEYDGGHRVPFFLSWPDGNLNAHDVNTLTASVDLMPTLIELCQLSLPSNLTFHGKSIVPLLHQAPLQWEDRTVVTDSQRLVNPVKWKQSAVMTDRWRLINGKKLYDINEDRLQSHDISKDHPEIVEKLRNEYDKWWEIVSTQFDEEIPISIGSNDSEVILTSHDWRNPECKSAWNQGLIRKGMICNGYWEILVESEGNYKIELYRWPKEEHREICKGIPSDDPHQIEFRQEAVPRGSWNLYQGGKSLNISSAMLQIGDKKYKKTVAPTDVSIGFLVPLEPGANHLETFFRNNEGLELGAYYVYVHKQ